jgi:hypothetical protein
MSQANQWPAAYPAMPLAHAHMGSEFSTNNHFLKKSFSFLLATYFVFKNCMYL